MGGGAEAMANLASPESATATRQKRTEMFLVSDVYRKVALWWCDESVTDPEKL